MSDRAMLYDLVRILFEAGGNWAYIFTIVASTVLHAVFIIYFEKRKPFLVVYATDDIPAYDDIPESGASGHAGRRPQNARRVASSGRWAACAPTGACCWSNGSTTATSIQP